MKKEISGRFKGIEIGQIEDLMKGNAKRFEIDNTIRINVTNKSLEINVENENLISIRLVDFQGSGALRIEPKTSNQIDIIL